MEKTFKNRKNFKILVGKKIGRLEILREESYTSKAGKVLRGYLCHCECGNEKVISHSSLISGRTNSCGCLMTEFNKGKKGNDYWKYRKPVDEKHIKDRKRLYNIWKTMGYRCNNQNFPSYSNYGARGIKVCQEWQGLSGFHNFRDWSLDNGYAENLTLDRIDNSEGYSPDNCRWATNEAQNSNKRTNVYLEYKGRKNTITQWTRILGVSKNALRYRINKGLSDEDVLLGTKEEKRKENMAILQKYLDKE